MLQASQEKRLFYRISEGIGERVFWVHGYTLDSSIWSLLWNRLPTFYHIGVDLPGHGRSSPLPSGWTLRDVARRVGDLAERMQARHLIGLSFGGMVAIQMAVEFPCQFDTLILASPALAGGPQDPESATCNLDLIRIAKSRGIGPWLRDRWMSCPPRIFEGVARFPDQFQELSKVVERHPWRELIDNSMTFVNMHVQTERELKKIGSTATILIGENDMESFKRSAELIRRSIPNCRRLYLPSAGHLSLLEVPEVAKNHIEEALEEK